MLFPGELLETWELQSFPTCIDQRNQGPRGTIGSRQAAREPHMGQNLVRLLFHDRTGKLGRRQLAILVYVHGVTEGVAS